MEDNFKEQRGIEAPHSSTPKGTSHWYVCCCAVKLWLYDASFGIQACKCGQAVSEAVKKNFDFVVSSHLTMFSCFKYATFDV